ncbi:hypothetical protein C2W62_02165, partial [Candidatus Entotheonella serta]
MYVTEFAAGLQSIDIRDCTFNASEQPQRLLGRVDTPSEAVDVEAADGFVYVTDSIHGLQVIRGVSHNPVDTDGDCVCVQIRRTRSAGDKPAKVRARSLVAWMAGRRETEFLKPIDNVIFGMTASHRAAAKANAQGA